MEYPDFRFPFIPYPVQLSFMKNLFSVIEDQKLGIFESPTGTGKSLSIICGALTWLKHHKLQHKLELEKAIAEAEKISRTDTGSHDWFTAAAQKHETSMLVATKRVELKQICDFERKVANTLARAKNLKKGNMDARRWDQLALNSSAQTPGEKEEDELLLLKTIDEGDEHLIDDYVSDEESASDKKDIFEDEYKDLQIIFCSRTHSQLSQFVREVQRSAFASEIRLVCLASRAVMCINPSVRKLGSNSMINDRCLELQKSKSQRTKTCGDSVLKRQKQKHSTGCELHTHQLEKDLRDLSLSDPHDIEELLTLAKDRKACPYYAARFAVNEAELLVVPYQTLLHKATREACGLNVKGNVVIIDEAHNLLETISQIHSVVLTGTQVSYTHSQLLQYSNRYKTKLSAKNMLYVKQLLFILNLLSKLLIISKAPMNPNEKQDSIKIWQVGDFLVEAHIDNVNLFKIIEFCRKTSLPQKLYGFHVVPNAEKPVKTSGMSSFLVGLKAAESPVNKVALEPASEPTPSPMHSPLFVVLEFLQCLLAGHEDGRVLCSTNAIPSKASLKYLLLNPASHFRDVIEEARSVVVAGGTMQPVSQFEHQLFGLAGAAPERVAHFTYGHVIPDSHVLPIVLTKGPSGKTLDFTYTSRNDPSVMDEMGQSLLNLCNIVKGGVVCFFPSYDYEELVSRRWKETKVWERLEKRKKIFREPKETSQVEQILKKYAECIEDCRKTNKELNGSLLLSVVGGKMSEGINFTDDLCRCVVMIGMPYPNKHSMELKEKMDYLNKHLPSGEKGTSPGAEYYQSLCMKAVNQSIGRAIRHRNDYATIILADHRYGKSSSIQDLPSWINKRIHIAEKFGDVMAMVRKFFASK